VSNLPTKLPQINRQAESESGWKLVVAFIYLLSYWILHCRRKSLSPSGTKISVTGWRLLVTRSCTVKRWIADLTLPPALM